MRSKIALLDQAKILQDLTITRLREDADRMEAEQKELSALQAELKVNLQRAEKYIEGDKEAAIDEVMREYNLTEADLRKMLQNVSQMRLVRGPRAQPCLPPQTTSN